MWIIRIVIMITSSTRQGSEPRRSTLTGTTIIQDLVTANMTFASPPPAMYSTTNIPQFPYELLRLIFEHLERENTSLCAILLASSTFHEEAQRILYRNVMLGGYNTKIKFLRTIALSPTRLAPIIHSYKQGWGYGAPPVKEFMKILPDVGRGLKAMCCLKQLDIMILPSLSNSHHVYIQMLSECTFNLERFNWFVSGGSTKELVEKFLPSQPSLRHLGLIYIGSPPGPLPLVPPTMCPQLISVTAGWEVIKALLPGCNISMLSWKDWNRDITDVDFETLATELKYVNALSIPLPFLHEREIHGPEILQYFPSLNAMEICHIDDHYNAYNEYIKIPESLTRIAKFPELQTLVLTGLPQECNRLKDIELVHLAFTHFGKHLKCVDIEISWKLYARYIQFQEIVQEISEEEV